MNSFPDRYDHEAESAIRVVPVTRGITCDNGARLFVVGLELWPDFSVVHHAMLRLDAPLPGYLHPHPDFLSLEIAMTDESGHRYSSESFDAGGAGRHSGRVFTRSDAIFEPIRPAAKRLTILPDNPTWKGWTISSGEPGIVVELPE
jgi:hypothetical protein